MPPKVKVTKDMVIDAAFEIAREAERKTSMQELLQRN